MINKLIKFLSHSLRFVYNPQKAMQYYQKKMSDPFFIQANLSHGFWVFGTPRAAQKIFTTKTDSYGKIFPDYTMSPLLGSNSLLLLSGDKHLQERKCLAPAFHGERMRLYAKTMRLATSSAFQDLKVGKRYNLYDLMKGITLNIIMETIFGVSDLKAVSLVRETTLFFIHSYTPTLMLFPLLRNRFWIPWRRFLKARTKLDTLLLKEIRHYKSCPDKNRTDILAKLIEYAFTNNSEIEDDNLLDELRTFLLAGHETSATALTWALYYSLTEPSIKNRLSEELKTIKSAESLEEILKLPFLSAVCQEALRIHPVVPLIMRTLNQNFEIESKQIKAGESIALSITLLHSHPETWENPEDFNPDRFLSKTYSPYEYAPFGGGVRRCLGASFALFEMKIILATILLHTRLGIIPDKNITPRLYGLTMGPRKKINLKILE